MKNLKFQVTPQVLELGVKIQTARVNNVKNSKLTDELDKYIASELEKIKTEWQGKNYKEDAVLLGFKELHTKVGKNNRDYPASPEVLLRLLLERNRFPRINCIVDIYNIVSAKTRLALGAHDTNSLNSNITLRLTKGNEKFLALNSHKPIVVPAGEYGYIDDKNNIICRLEVLQTETTKITLDTTNVFLIIQGNSNTSSSYVEQGAREVIDLILKFCGGKYTYLNSLN